MTFFEQFERLRLTTPRLGLQTVQNEGSQFCQYTERSKGCYMTFASYQSEDCMYNHRVFYCNTCNDCALCNHCELCYECVDCIRSYNCDYCIYCEQCTDCFHCQYCTGCENCFGCTGLRQKKFHIFNEKVGEEEYKKRLSELKNMPPREISKKLNPLALSVPRSAMYGKNNEDSYGENIHNCKDVFWAFDSKKLWDCQYCYHCDESKNLVDSSHLGWSEDCYEIMSGGGLNDCKWCYGCWDSNNLEYCDSVFNSHDCFGCVGLNHGEYCILNEKHPKQEYFEKIAEIKKQMKNSGEYGAWYPSTYPEVVTYGL